MARVIFEIPLQDNHIRRGFMFFARDGTEELLPPAFGDLKVTNGTPEGWWTFKCKGGGGNCFSISGSGWKSFAKSCSVNDVVTLSKCVGQEFYRIGVRA